MIASPKSNSVRTYRIIDYERTVNTLAELSAEISASLYRDLIELYMKLKSNKLHKPHLLYEHSMVRICLPSFQRKSLDMLLSESREQVGEPHCQRCKLQEHRQRDTRGWSESYPLPIDMRPSIHSCSRSALRIETAKT